MVRNRFSWTDPTELVARQVYLREVGNGGCWPGEKSQIP